MPHTIESYKKKFKSILGSIKTDASDKEKRAEYLLHPFATISVINDLMFEYRMTALSTIFTRYHHTSKALHIITLCQNTKTIKISSAIEHRDKSKICWYIRCEDGACYSVSREEAQRTLDEIIAEIKTYKDLNPSGDFHNLCEAIKSEITPPTIELHACVAAI